MARHDMNALGAGSLLEPFASLPQGDPALTGCACPTGVDDGIVHAQNCQRGGILWKFIRVDILAGADGQTFTTQADEATPGNFIRFQPIEGVIRVRYLLMSAAGVGLITDAGYGAVLKGRKQVQPTLDGSFITDNVCGPAANLGFEDGIGKWVDPGNWQCVAPATNDSPVDCALVNTQGAGNLIGMCFGLGYQYTPPN